MILHVIPSQSNVVTAASATEPLCFKIAAPISAHSFPFDATAPCRSVFRLNEGAACPPTIKRKKMTKSHLYDELRAKKHKK